MITVAFSQMVYFFCVEAPFTHGEDGIQAVPQGRALGFIDLSNPWILYCFVAAIFLFGFLVVQRAVNSPFGEILKAIRENVGGFIGVQAMPVPRRMFREYDALIDSGDLKPPVLPPAAYYDRRFVDALIR